MNNRAIGILDSGVGGLSIWSRIIKELPHESTIYLADSKNVPYGDKTEKEIYSLAKTMIEFLLEKRVKLIVVACNTITVSCIDQLRKDFSQIHIIGIVPVVKTACERTKNKKIGILSTKKTSESQYQKDLIAKFANGCKVVSIGTSNLVPFVERGEIDGKEVKKVLRSDLKEFIEKGVDAIALGCSHFPFLKKAMQEIMGENVLILDSSSAVARQTRKVLENNNILSDGNSFYEFYTTGDASQFETVVKKLTENQSIKAASINL